MTSNMIAATIVHEMFGNRDDVPLEEKKSLIETFKRNDQIMYNNKTGENIRTAIAKIYGIDHIAVA